MSNKNVIIDYLSATAGMVYEGNDCCERTCVGSGGNDIIPTVEGMISRTSNPKVHYLYNSSLRII